MKYFNSIKAVMNKSNKTTNEQNENKAHKIRHFYCTALLKSRDNNLHLGGGKQICVLVEGECSWFFSDH